MKNDRKFLLNPRLREARVGRGWSQQKLADLVGTTPVNISRWENGSTFPSPYFRQRLGEVFGKMPAELDLLPPPSRVFRILNVPIMRNPFFTGRGPLLALLHERLSTARMAALTQAQALYGLGGIGKTQTAAEYAFRYGEDYTNVFWMQAATRDTLVADFVTLAQLLDLPEKDEQDQPRIVAAVKRWLTAHEGWLLILDNADDLRLAQEFLPTSHKGYVLFTTRAQAAGAIAASIEVEQLTPQEGSLLLLRWTKLLDRDTPLDHVQAADRAAAERIVREMGGLPLALVQAGAYVEETGCSLADYLRLYATHRKELLAWRSRLLLDYPETVVTTWSLSFQQVEQQSPAAAESLNNLAVLSRLQGDYEQAEGFHRQALAIREKKLGPEHPATAESLNNLGVLYRTQGKYEQAEPLLQQALSIREQSLGSEHPDTLLTFMNLAKLYLEQRKYEQAERLLKQTLATSERVVEPGHPLIAQNLNLLARLSYEQGDHERAETLWVRALAIIEKAFGPEHHTTAERLNDLAELSFAQGRYTQAQSLCQRALSICEKILGFEHPDTIAVRRLLTKILSKREVEQDGDHHPAPPLR